MYGVYASGTSMDRVAQDKGMLGLCSLVNGQRTTDVKDTHWSQWRYVVKLRCSGSGTSRKTLALYARLEVSTRTHQDPPLRGYRAWFLHEKRWRRE